MGDSTTCCGVEFYNSICGMGPFKCYVTQMGWGGCHIFWKKGLRRCKVQRYYRYEGVGGGPISRKKALRNT